MKLRTRTVEKKSLSNNMAPEAAECECSDIVTGLILCGVPQFTRVMSDGVVKIPDGFVLEHRNMIGRRVSLEPSDSKGRVFEVMLSTRIVGKRQSTLSFGTGWQEFRAISRLQEGDLLIFALVGLSQFLVYILRGHSEIAKRAMSSYFTRPNGPVTRAQVRNSSNHKRILKKEPDPDEPIQQTNRHTYFERRLFANAFAKGRGKGGRYFEFPQAFLRLHANEVGDKLEFVVSNKSQVWMIETSKYENENILTTGRRVYLCKGWPQFSEDNGLQQGDLLGFSLVSHSKFLVTIVARASDQNS